MGGSRSHLDKKKLENLPNAAFYPVFCDSIAVRLTKWHISLVLCYLLLYMVVVILFPVWGLSNHVV